MSNQINWFLLIIFPLTDQEEMNWQIKYAQFLEVVAAEGERRRALRLAHRLGHVRAHKRDAVVRLQHRVHDLVLVAGVLRHAVILERADVQLAAEDRMVELHRLPRRAGEIQIRVYP